MCSKLRVRLEGAGRRDLGGVGPRLHHALEGDGGLRSTARSRPDRFGAEGPVDHWLDIRTEIHHEVCREGFDLDRKDVYPVLRIPDARRQRADDPDGGFPSPRTSVVGTVDAVQRELSEDGFVRRYPPEHGEVDGVSGTEGTFLPCSFWLVNNLALIGRTEEVEELFERTLSIANELSPFSEEYDPEGKRLVGNFPQAFTHPAMVRTAATLSGSRPAKNARGRRPGVARAPRGSEVKAAVMEAVLLGSGRAAGAGAERTNAQVKATPAAATPTRTQSEFASEKERMVPPQRGRSRRSRPAPRHWARTRSRPVPRRRFRLLVGHRRHRRG